MKTKIPQGSQHGKVIKLKTKKNNVLLSLCHYEQAPKMKPFHNYYCSLPPEEEMGRGKYKLRNGT